MHLDATVIAIFIGGVVQPYLQEFILRNKVSARTALLATTAFSLIIAIIGTYVVGGFAHLAIPAFSLADPSPLLEYLLPYWTAAFTLSQLVFHGTESTKADPHVVVDTTATVPLTPPIANP